MQTKLPRIKAARVKTARKRKHSSTLWLQRQLNDPYVAAAKAAQYRSRAAFKLIEILDKTPFIKPHHRIVDLGAAPGGWTQIIAERQNGQGQLVAIDLLPIDPIQGATIIEADAFAPHTMKQLQTIMPSPWDGIVSDMAPSTIGHRSTDYLRMVGLAQQVIDLAQDHVRVGGYVLMKVFDGGEDKDLLPRLKALFNTVKRVKPPASRKDSRELYLLALDKRKDTP